MHAPRQRRSPPTASSTCTVPSTPPTAMTSPVGCQAQDSSLPCSTASVRSICKPGSPPSTPNRRTAPSSQAAARRWGKPALAEGVQRSWLVVVTRTRQTGTAIVQPLATLQALSILSWPLCFAPALLRSAASPSPPSPNTPPLRAAGACSEQSDTYKHSPQHSRCPQPSPGLTVSTGCDARDQATPPAVSNVPTSADCAQSTSLMVPSRCAANVRQCWLMVSRAHATLVTSMPSPTTRCGSRHATRVSAGWLQAGCRVQRPSCVVQGFTCVYALRCSPFLLGQG